MRRWAILADLLEYPTPGLREHLDETLRATAAGDDGDDADDAVREALRPFRDGLARDGYRRMQEAYTEVFDFAAETAPYLGHHLFGEDMRRGAFMARLKKRYSETGLLDPASVEVPDHFSAVLRFLDRLEPGDEADELVRDCLVPASARLLRALQQKGSPYASVIGAVTITLRRTGRGVTGC